MMPEQISEWFMAEIARGVKSAQTGPLVDYEAAAGRAAESREFYKQAASGTRRAIEEIRRQKDKAVV